ncbi:hypothetical protein [Amnibacterium endophyticum]|uniref:ATP-dependent DNA ligase n=1 Tax=Amnibacterium endophyticum TaxID=2109337 RepID=A0ABW4LHZ8_9MICO
MDATGWWDVEVPTPLGRLHFDVRIREDGRVSASYRGRPIPVPAMRTEPEGDGVRATWTQRLTVPVRVEVHVDALIVGDRLTGTADAGRWMPPVRLEGRRVG